MNEPRIRTYPVEGGYVVAIDDQWLEGVYDTEATARRAALHFDDAELAALGRIYHLDGQNRPVNRADLDAVEQGRQA